MSNTDGLVKAIEALKVCLSADKCMVVSTQRDALHRSSFGDLRSVSSLFRGQKGAVSVSDEKKSHCATLADQLLAVGDNPELVQLYLPPAVNLLVQLSDDADLHVRTASDEFLNKIINGFVGANVSLLLLELYKVIKQNGSPRIVSVALSKFAVLADCISIQKRRPYAVNLAPCLVTLISRDDSIVQETLQIVIDPLSTALAVFLSESDTRSLTRAFVSRLSHDNTSFRRVAVNCIVTVISASRCSDLFLHEVTSSFLDDLSRAQGLSDEHVLGLIWCLRDLIPLIAEHGEEITPSLCQQLWSTLLQYSHHTNHNVVTGSVEAVCQFLRFVPPILLEWLMSEPSCVREEVPSQSQQTAEVLQSSGRYVDDVIDPLRYDSAVALPFVSRVDRGVENAGDKCVPLLSACKSLVHRFLLSVETGEPRPDAEVRVSVKVLAVHSLSAAVGLMPRLSEFPLDSDHHNNQLFGSVLSSCVTSISRHSDPQLRGSIALLCGVCLKSADVMIRNSPSDQLLTECLSTLEKLLGDGNHVTVRLAVEAVSMCVTSLLHSWRAPTVPSLVAVIAKQAASSYWLVKVTVCNTLAALPLLHLHTVWSRSGVSRSQPRCDSLILSTFSSVLQDADVRVQSAAADALSRFCSQLALIPTNHQLIPAELYCWSFGSETALHCHELSLSHSSECCQSSEKYPAMITSALSSIVEKIVCSVMVASTVSSQQLSGFLLAMRSLMEKYPATSFPTAWQITAESDGSLYELCSSLLVNSHHVHSLSAHGSLLFLASHLAVGMFRCRQYTVKDGEEPRDTTDVNQCFTAAFLTHLVRMLNLICLIVNNRGESSPEQSKPILSNLSSAIPLSPVRRAARSSLSRSHSMSTVSDYTATDGESPVKHVVSQTRGNFSTSPEFTQLYSALKAMHTSSQVNLSSSRLGNKVMALLDECVNSVARISECVDWQHELSLLEEVLTYLSIAIRFAPLAVVHCVHQLLRSVFRRPSSAVDTGVPDSSPRGAPVVRSAPDDAIGSVRSDAVRHGRGLSGGSLYDTILNGPHSRLLTAVASHSSGQTRKKSGCLDDWRSSFSDFDREFLSTHIVLFEPVFSKALKMYTVCCDAEVQRQVLLLLIELLQMNVSYDMIDSEQMFVGFVLQQLGFIEEGQMWDGHLLVPGIFRYLILLSEQGSSVTSPICLSKVIQLCDGLIASGLPVEQYVAPALEPIVNHIFVRTERDVSSVTMDAHGEVVLNMLSRLMQHPQVMKLLALVLEQCRGERYIPIGSDFYLQLWDRVASLFVGRGFMVKSGADIGLLHQFLLGLPSDHLSPSQHVLLLLLTPQPSALADIEPWALSIVSALLLLIHYVSETSLLEQLARADLRNTAGIGQGFVRCINASDDSASSPPTLFISLVLSFVNTLIVRLNELSDQPRSCLSLKCLPLLLSQLLQFVTFVVISGRYKECARSAAWLVSSGAYNVETASEAFIAQSRRHPLLLLAWCNLLSVLNVSRLELWRSFLRSTEHTLGNGLVCCPSLSQELVLKGCLILVSDCLCSVTDDCELLSWLLSEHVTDIVMLCDEPPVTDLLSRIHRSRSASALLLQSISTRCSPPLSNALLARRILQCVEGVAASQCGPLLLLISRVFFTSCFAVVAVDAISLACRRLEVVLAAGESLLSRTDFLDIGNQLLVAKLSSRGFDRLKKLFDQVGTQLFGLSPPEGAGSDDENEVDCLLNISNPNLSDRPPNQAWFLNLIQSCLSWRPVSPAILASCAPLLARLEQSDVERFLADDVLGLDLLKHFFSLSSASDAFQRQSDFDGFALAETALERHLSHILSVYPDFDKLLACFDSSRCSLQLGGTLSVEASLSRIVPMFGAVSAYLTTDPCRRVNHLSSHLASVCLLALQTCCYLVSGCRGRSSIKVGVVLDAARLCLRCQDVVDRLLPVEVQCVVVFSGLVHRLVLLLIDSLPSPDVDVCFKLFDLDTSRRISSLLMWLDNIDSGQAKIQSTVGFVPALRGILTSILRLPLLSSLSKLPPDVYGHLELTVPFINGVPVASSDIVNDKASKSNANATDQSSGDLANKPPDGVTDQSAGGVTDELPVGVTNRLLDDVTHQPPDDVTGQSSGDINHQTSDDVNHQPPDDGTANSSDDVTHQPLDGVTGQSSGDVNHQPSDDVSHHPSDNPTHQPSDDVTSQSSGDVNHQPSDDVTHQPSDDLTGQSPDDVTHQPSDDVTHELLDDVGTQQSTGGGAANVDSHSSVSISHLSKNRCIYSVPSEVLQEGDVLRRYIKRVEVVGWCDRRDFEETWMTYLSVLNCSVEDSTQSVDEQAVLMQTQCLAVRGMTSLLLQTLTLEVPGYPTESRILHHARHSPPVFLPGSVIGQFDEFLRQLQTAVNSGMSMVAPSINLSDGMNIDRRSDSNVYGLGQLSLRYIRLSISGREGVHSRREELMSRAGVDTKSCVVFLLQLYDTWLTNPVVELRVPLLTEVIRSAVLLSDVMFETGQFRWLLERCCALWNVVSVDDEFTLALLVLGICKMAAVLDNSEPAVLELVKRVTDWGLQGTNSEPVRVHVLHGALYLLQLGPGQLSSAVLYSVFNFCQEHFLAIDSFSCGSELDLITWAALVYLLRHYDSDSSCRLQTREMLHHVCRIATNCSSDRMFESLLKGLEQLVVCGAITGHSGPLQLAVQLLRKQCSVFRLVLSTSLAFSCLYVVPSHHFQQESRSTALEIFSLLIIRIKGALPAVAETMSPVIASTMLNFCPASELINRVVAEFLSPVHGHPRVLAPAIFQVFGACCSSGDRHLMVDWLLFTLPSLTSHSNHSSRGKSGWHLCCLMISASSNVWLRAAFPLLLVCASNLDSCFSKRLVSYLLLVSANDFYQQIGSEKGAEFITVIKRCASDDPAIYGRILNLLIDTNHETHSELSS